MTILLLKSCQSGLKQLSQKTHKSDSICLRVATKWIQWQFDSAESHLKQEKHQHPTDDELRWKRRHLPPAGSIPSFKRKRRFQSEEVLKVSWVYSRRQTLKMWRWAGSTARWAAPDPTGSRSLLTVSDCQRSCCQEVLFWPGRNLTCFPFHWSEELPQKSIWHEKLENLPSGHVTLPSHLSNKLCPLPQYKGIQCVT